MQNCIINLINNSSEMENMQVSRILVCVTYIECRNI